MAYVNSFAVQNYVNHFIISSSVLLSRTFVFPSLHFILFIHIFHHSIFCFPSRPSFLPYLFTHFLAFMHIN